MIVVDVNVVAYFMIEGDKTAQARDLLNHDSTWRLPPLWRHEYLNVLATFTREGGATLAEVQGLWRQAIQLFGPLEQRVDMESALALAGSQRVSAYDAQYIALAQQLHTVCVTEDRRLLRTFPEVARSMHAFANP